MNLKANNLCFIIFILFISTIAKAQKEEIEAARNYILQKKGDLGFSENDILDMRVSDSYLSKTTGWHHLYFKQYFNNIEVFNGIANTTLKNGHLINLNHTFASQVELLKSKDQIKNVLGANKILNTVAKHLKISQTDKIYNKVSNKLNENSISIEETFNEESLSNDPIKSKLYWYRYNSIVDGKSKEKASLVWSVKLTSKDRKNGWQVQVDANSGLVINVFDDVIKCEFGERPHKHNHDQELDKSSKTPNTPLDNNSYNIFNFSTESPIHGNRVVVTNPYTIAIPTGTGPGPTNGWHDNGTTVFTDTRGNNVLAQDDTNADNSGGNRPNPANYIFDYPYALTNTPAQNQNAAITNLFYWNNIIHDVLYKMGFDEPSGNFQTNNLNRGGLGNDAVNADAQDGSGTNNANMSTPSDGSSPRMQMYIWDIPSTYDADSDFDNAIISHEYGHGWSLRLTGGPSTTSCLNNEEQGGEGWSDYLGLMMTTDWANLSPTIASANIPKGIGTYVLGETTSGNGIRPFRYSHDLTVNGTVTYNKVGDSNFSIPHGVGSIWCTMLWDLTWEIILQDQAIEPNIYNTNNMIGNVAALKLVNEGLRLQPCSPSFVDARNAIIQADIALFNGKYSCAISKAFSRRGLGKNATTGTSSNDRIVTQDFTPLAGNSLITPTQVQICSGQTLNYTATAFLPQSTGYKWSRAAVAGISNPANNDSSAIINEVLVNTTSNPISVTYTIEFSPSGCGIVENTQQNVSVIVNPSNIAPLNSEFEICQGRTMPQDTGLIGSQLPPTKSLSGTLNSSSPKFKRGGTSDYYYKLIKYVPTQSKSDTFLLNSPNFDAFLYLYKNQFFPNNYTTNYLTADDDSGVGLNSRIIFNVTKDSVYYLVASTFSSLETGDFTVLSTTNGMLASENLWFVSNNSPNPIYSGKKFNPLVVPNSGLTNTNIPVIKKYYYASSANPTCRYECTFKINPANVDSITSGIISSSDTLCYVFNQGNLILSGYTGTVFGWELKVDSDPNIKTIPALNGDTLKYKGLIENMQVRAILSRSGCVIAKSKSINLYVSNINQNLVDTVTDSVYYKIANLKINSNQKILDPSRAKYEAGRSITLNSGFETKDSVVFAANIITNSCPIVDTLDLQPDSLLSKDTDISSLFQNSNFALNKYIVPFAWNQFGTSEIRRTLMQFDLSSIPSNAVIDSAYLYLFFSQRLINENPQYTGHFGQNAFEILRITQPWESNVVNWTNQPSTTIINKVNVPVFSTNRQNYPKINLTNLVRDQFVNGNNGILIKHATETPYKITCLTSSEETNATLRPRLIVFYKYY